MPDLTDFQLEVTRLFFSLPASKGFLLAGGAALLAQHLTTRPTELTLNLSVMGSRARLQTSRPTALPSASLSRSQFVGSRGAFRRGVASDLEGRNRQCDTFRPFRPTLTRWVVEGVLL
jgi:hypothetical protein